MADRKEFDIDGKPLSSLRVVDLKQELEKRGMSKSGSKKELSDRLKMQLQLEKLHESASTDEGHVPNLGLQDDEIAEHSDLIKDYLAKQQQIYEIQKEAIRRVELEEQRVRESSEASAGDTSQEEEEIESNLPKEVDEPCAEDLSVSKSKRKEEKEKEKVKMANIVVEEKNKNAELQEDVESSGAILSTKSEVQAEMTPDPEHVLKAPIVQSEAVFEEEKSDDNGETSIAIAQIEPVVEETPDTEMQEQISTNEKTISDEPPNKESTSEIEENAAAVDSITLEVHIAPEDMVSLPESIAAKTPEKITKSNKNMSETSKLLESNSAPSIAESPITQSETSGLQELQMPVEASKQPAELDNIKKESICADTPSPKHKIKLKRPKLSTSRSAQFEGSESVETSKSDDKKLQVESKSPTHTTVSPAEINEEEKASERIPEPELPAKEVVSNNAEVESHGLSSEAADIIKDHVASDSPMQQTGKKEEGDVKVGDKQTSNKKSSRSESPPRARRRRRSSSTESSSNESSSSSRSRPRYRSGSSSSRSKSRSPSTSRDTLKEKPVVSLSEESMETNEDSVSRPFSKQDVGVDTEGEDKTADVDDSSSPADTSQVSKMPKDSKEVIDKLPEKEFPSRITSRKISLSSSKVKKEDTEGKENGAVDEEKPQRKRRWGGSSAVAAAVGKKLSLTISTDSLKGLIPDVKPLSTLNSGLQEPISEPTVEKPIAKQIDSIPAAKDERPTTPVTTPTSAPGNKRDLIIYRTVTQVVKDNAQTKFPEREASKGKLVVKNSASIGYNDDAGAIRRSPSPPRYPPSCIIHIRNLVRPFTDILLKELLSRTGTLVQGGFWMDKIKSKCYATFETEEQAVTTRHALHGIQWPYSNPKRLSVDFATQDELEFHRGLPDNPDLKKVVPVGRQASVPERVKKSPPPSRRKEPIVATTAPTGRQRKDSQRSERDKEKEKEKEKKEPKHGASRSQPEGRPERGIGGRDREAERVRGREREVTAGVQHQPPIREWDRDKIGEKSPGERARAARNRGRSPSSRSRSRSRLVRSPQPDGFGQGRERNREAAMRDRRDRKDIRRKDEEEAPAKLLDDLFHKTKTTPCIYWLPLTGDQAKVREEERKQRQVEREKRRQMEQTDRDRSAGANVEQNRRNRESDNSRIRKRSESPARSRTRRR